MKNKIWLLVVLLSWGQPTDNLKILLYFIMSTYMNINLTKGNSVIFTKFYNYKKIFYKCNGRRLCFIHCCNRTWSQPKLRTRFLTLLKLNLSQDDLEQHPFCIAYLLFCDLLNLIFTCGPNV